MRTPASVSFWGRSGRGPRGMALGGRGLNVKLKKIASRPHSLHVDVGLAPIFGEMNRGGVDDYSFGITGITGIASEGTIHVHPAHQADTGCPAAGMWAGGGIGDNVSLPIRNRLGVMAVLSLDSYLQPFPLLEGGGEGAGRRGLLDTPSSDVFRANDAKRSPQLPLNQLPTATIKSYHRPASLPAFRILSSPGHGASSCSREAALSPTWLVGDEVHLPLADRVADGKLGGGGVMDNASVNTNTVIGECWQRTQKLGHRRERDGPKLHSRRGGQLYLEPMDPLVGTVQLCPVLGRKPGKLGSKRQPLV